MKQIVFIFMAILLATGMASAQKKAVISAETTSFDFGTIKEADGKVGFANRSVSFDTPVAPGKKAQIKVTFDPAGRPGPFTKTISVYSNGKTGSFIMNIRGEVE